MSVILVLVPAVYLAPLAVAATAAAVKAIEKRAETSNLLRVETRMKNEELLTQSMGQLGYTVRLEGKALVGEKNGSTFSMVRDPNGLWVAHFSGDVSEQDAITTLTNLDIEYGKLVQAALIARLQERLPASNLKYVNQVTNQDESITVTLAVNA